MCIGQVRSTGVVLHVPFLRLLLPVGSHKGTPSHLI